VNTEGYDNYRGERERHRRTLRRELLGLILNYEPGEIRAALDLYERNPKQFSADVMQEMSQDQEAAFCAQFTRITDASDETQTI
jgi:hypothetical protein